jgi:hypothetical protein
VFVWDIIFANVNSTPVSQELIAMFGIIAGYYFGKNVGNKG